MPGSVVFSDLCFVSLLSSECPSAAFSIALFPSNLSNCFLGSRPSVDICGVARGSPGVFAIFSDPGGGRPLLLLLLLLPHLLHLHPHLANVAASLVAPECGQVSDKCFSWQC